MSQAVLGSPGGQQAAPPISFLPPAWDPVLVRNPEEAEVAPKEAMMTVRKLDQDNAASLSSPGSPQKSWGFGDEMEAQ